MSYAHRTTRTKRGAIRRYNAIIAACYRDARGGTQYGGFHKYDIIGPATPTAAHKEVTPT